MTSVRYKALLHWVTCPGHNVISSWLENDQNHGFLLQRRDIHTFFCIKTEWHYTNQTQDVHAYALIHSCNGFFPAGWPWFSRTLDFLRRPVLDLCFLKTISITGYTQHITNSLFKTLQKYKNRMPVINKPIAATLWCWWYNCRPGRK